MRLAPIIMAGLLGLLSGAAFAACEKDLADVRASGKYERFVAQTLARQFPADPAIDSATQTGAAAGFVLGRQVQYLGPSESRRAWFDCVQEAMLAEISLTALATGKNPVPAEEAFLSAVLGVLSEQEYETLGVDTSGPVASIFDEDWTGDWFVEARTKTLHKNELKVFLSFQTTAAAQTVTLSGARGDGTGLTVPVTIKGETARFAHMMGAEHRYVWTLDYDAPYCSGVIETHGPTAIVEWEILSCQRLE